MVKMGSGDTRLQGGTRLEVSRDDGSRPDERIKKQTAKKKGTVVDIDEPYQTWREGLEHAPNKCRLWTRSNGKKCVLFPDGSVHTPDTVGFDVESWQSAEYFDTRPLYEQEREEGE